MTPTGHPSRNSVVPSNTLNPPRRRPGGNAWAAGIPGIPAGAGGTKMAKNVHVGTCSGNLWGPPHGGLPGEAKNGRLRTLPDNLYGPPHGRPGIPGARQGTLREASGKHEASAEDTHAVGQEVRVPGTGILLRRQGSARTRQGSAMSRREPHSFVKDPHAPRSSVSTPEKVVGIGRVPRIPRAFQAFPGH